MNDTFKVTSIRDNVPLDLRSYFDFGFRTIHQERPFDVGEVSEVYNRIDEIDGKFCSLIVVAGKLREGGNAVGTFKISVLTNENDHLNVELNIEFR